MTRETKIGLLVGLAFLLVVGILLSEHITGATERPAAPLAEAGHGISRGMSAPGAAADEPSRVLEPQQPVPTPMDLTPKPQIAQAPAPQAVVPVAAQANPVVAEVTTQTIPVAPPTVVAPTQPQQPVNQTTVIVRAPTDPFANTPIAKVAREMGEPVVQVTNATKASAKAPVVPAVNTVPGTTGAREYKAQAGDTLSRLAGQVPGGNVKANRDAIVQLNPSLQKDPNRVLSGHTYLLPTAAATTNAAPVTPVADKAKPAKPQPVQVAANDSAASRVYVVKAGDTLSKIASNELGSKTEIGTIRKLNADVLKGTDVIKIDMKLKLPGKAALASVR